MTRALLLAALPLAAGLLSAPPLSAQAASGPSSGDGRASDALVLRPGDLVRLQVQDEPALAGEFPVNEDGATLFPLVGTVPVAGRPFGEVRTDLRERFRRDLVNPVVVATPLVRLAVLGEVRAPGVFPVDPTMTLGDVLAAVGGLAPQGDAGRIALVRDGEVIQARIEPNAPLLETPFRSGDRIVVGRQSWFRAHMPVLVGAAASVAAAAVTSFIVRR